jgi:prepilin-type N-terminal cleavage/methylation domain-containing protein
MLRFSIKHFRPGITLIELLVVIVIVGILAGVVGPNLGGWNCRQELKNDFAELNGFLEELKIESVARNRTMLASVRSSGKGNNALIKAYQGPQGKKKTCGTGAGWEYLGAIDIADYEAESALENFSKTVCFNADATATAGSYTLGRQCSALSNEYWGKGFDTFFQYKNQIFGATGYIEKLKLDTFFCNRDNCWEDM